MSDQTRTENAIELGKTYMLLDAANKREAALREELERATSRYDREVLGLNNELDPIGGDPAGGYKNDNARLQHRLTVAEQEALFHKVAYEASHRQLVRAEQREVELKELLREVTDKCNVGFNMRERLLAALKTAEYGESVKPKMSLAEVFAFNDDHDSRPERED